MNSFVAALEGLYPGYEVVDVRFMLQSGASLPEDVAEMDAMFAEGVNSSVEISPQDLVAA